MSPPGVIPAFTIARTRHPCFTGFSPPACGGGKSALELLRTDLPTRLSRRRETSKPIKAPTFAPTSAMMTRRTGPNRSSPNGSSNALGKPRTRAPATNPTAPRTAPPNFQGTAESRVASDFFSLSGSGGGESLMGCDVRQWSTHSAKDGRKNPAHRAASGVSAAEGKIRFQTGISKRCTGEVLLG